MSSAAASTELIFACRSWHEAQALADHLFAQALIVTAECIASAPESRHYDAAPGGVKLLVSAAAHLADDIRAQAAELLGRPAAVIAA